jgi:hypothetical protein
MPKMWGCNTEINRQTTRHYRHWLKHDYPDLSTIETRGLHTLDILNACCAIEQITAEKRGIA